MNIRKIIREEINDWGWTKYSKDYNEYDINEPPKHNEGDKVMAYVSKYPKQLVKATILTIDYREHRGIEKCVYKIELDIDNSHWFMGDDDIFKNTESK